MHERMDDARMHNLLGAVPDGPQREELRRRVRHLQSLGWTDLWLWTGTDEEPCVGDLVGVPPGEKSSVRFFEHEFPEWEAKRDA